MLKFSLLSVNSSRSFAYGCLALYIAATVALAQVSFLRLMLFYIGQGDVDNRVFGNNAAIGRVIASMNWFFPALCLTALTAGLKARQTLIGWAGMIFAIADAVVFVRLWLPLYW